MGWKRDDKVPDALVSPRARRARNLACQSLRPPVRLPPRSPHPPTQAGADEASPGADSVQPDQGSDDNERSYPPAVFDPSCQTHPVGFGGPEIEGMRQ